MIYKTLLVSQDPIMNAVVDYISDIRTTSKAPRIPGIDARILRTCRKVYKEALPILYEQNRFQFDESWDIQIFAHRGCCELGMDLPPTPDKYIGRPYGRLNLIRSLILRMGSSLWCPRTRTRLYKEWHTFLDTEDSSPTRIGFPALQRLTLDLSDWRPGPEETEWLNVAPLVRKFSRSQGLQELIVKGLYDKSNLLEISRLVRMGGSFRVIDLHERVILDIFINDRTDLEVGISLLEWSERDEI